MSSLRRKDLFRLVAAAVVRFYPNARTTVVVLQLIWDLADALKLINRDDMAKDAAAYLDETDFWNAKTEERFIPLFTWIYHAMNAVNRLAVINRADKEYWNKMLAAGIISHLQWELLSARNSDQPLSIIQKEKVIGYMASLHEYIGDIKFPERHVAVLKVLAEIDLYAENRNQDLLRVAYRDMDEVLRTADGKFALDPAIKLPETDTREILLRLETIRDMIAASLRDSKQQLMSVLTMDMEKSYVTYMNSVLPHTWSHTRPTVYR
jgi:hypothetical protein